MHGRRILLKLLSYLWQKNIIKINIIIYCKKISLKLLSYGQKISLKLLKSLMAGKYYKNYYHYL